MKEDDGNSEERSRADGSALEIEIAGRKRVRDITGSRVLMKGKSKAAEAWRSTLKLREESEVESAEESRINIADNATIKDTKYCHVEIKGGREIVLGRGTLGEMTRETNAKITLKKGAEIIIKRGIKENNIIMDGGTIKYEQ